MKATAESIIDFMDGKKRSFVIPVYQRNYDWSSKEQCSILWEDLEYIIKIGIDKPHFFGSIVSVTDVETGDLIIIDGQQRLTTISLLMLAIAHRIQEFNNVISQHNGEELVLPDINEVLGLCIDNKKQNKLKLKLLRGDMEAYQCIVDKSKCPTYDKTHIVQNYRFFYSKITPENINDIYKATQKLEIVDIILGVNDDNPQQVFESLNSKGLGLCDADKIRNFILIGLDYAEQTNLYKKYWEHIEENAGTSPTDTTNFIWNYLAYKTNKRSRLPEIYTQFKDYKSTLGDSESILKDLLHSSEIYYKITTGGYDSEIIKSKISNLFKLTKSGSIPLLLDVFDCYDNKRLTYDDVIEILDIIESYFIRRAVCGLGTASTEKFFLMNKQIHKIMNKYTNASYVDAFRYLVYSETGRLRFPSDPEVVTALRTNDIYTRTQQTCKYILGQIEQHYNPNEHVDTLPLTVEHIMPQKLDSEWETDLGAEYGLVHTKYLHTLGNLTLTGYNSLYSNKPFRIKKRCTRGFDESPLYLNSFMKNTEQWTEKEITSRCDDLIKEFLNIWKIHKPNQNYAYDSNVERVALDNTDIHNQITNRKPKSFYFEVIDQEIEVTSWKDLYYQVINILYRDPNYIKRMQHAFKFGNRGNFEGIISQVEETQGQQGEVLWEQIIPGESVYFLMKKNAGDIIKSIRLWFEYLNIDQSNLEINLR